MAKRRIFDLTLVSILGVAVIGSTVALTKQHDYEFFDEMITVKSIIDRQFVEKPDSQAMREGAIQGMIEALDDPYTVYVPAADTAAFNKDLTGDYVGIGAQVTIQGGWLTIVTPLEDSPAYRAGIMAEDRIVEIDGESTRDLTIDEAVDRLLGEPGTPVKLTIERSGTKQELTIVRDRVKTRAVKGFRRDPASPEEWSYIIDPARKVAYIRLTQFTPGCAREVLDALRKAQSEAGEIGGLVLDLRYNPGGLLNEAEAIADMFLSDGVIVSTKGRTIAEKISRATEAGTLPDFPIAVLVNGMSASASEVLAGALEENDRAIVVGTRTFGKGSVQALINIPGSGAELKITEQRYYLPSGRSISRHDDSPEWGVDPTAGFYVPMTDEQTRDMFEVRRRQDILRSAEAPVDAPVPDVTESWSDPEWILSFLKDPQLAAAVRGVQQRKDVGMWTPTGESGIEGAQIALDELRRVQRYRERLIAELTRADKRIEALETASAAVDEELPDLWADTIDIEGGVMIIRDKAGAVIAELKIPATDLEQRLIDAGLTPAAPVEPSTPANPAETKKPE